MAMVDVRLIKTSKLDSIVTVIIAYLTIWEVFSFFHRTLNIFQAGLTSRTNLQRKS